MRTPTDVRDFRLKIDRAFACCRRVRHIEIRDLPIIIYEEKVKKMSHEIKNNIKEIVA